MSEKLKEIFDIDIYDTTNRSGQYISVGYDSKGEPITVEVPKSGGGLVMDPEIRKKISDPDYLARAREEERKRNSQALDSYFNNVKVEGPYAQDFERNRALFEIPKQFSQMIAPAEDLDDDLTDRDRAVMRRARDSAALIDPSLLKGLNDTMLNSLNYKNLPQVMDFLKHLKMENVDFKKLDGPGVTEYFNRWKAIRRPSMAVVIQRLQEEADKIFFDWLLTNKTLDPNTKSILKRDVEARIEFLAGIREESGQPLFSMDDFVIQKFYFQEYGLIKEDVEWFNRAKPVPGQPGITMGDYFDEFEARIGIKYEDIYYHFWKEVEKEEQEKEKQETMGEAYDTESLTENDKKMNFVEAKPEPSRPTTVRNDEGEDIPDRELGLSDEFDIDLDDIDII